jgi:hypothetical protein
MKDGPLWVGLGVATSVLIWGPSWLVGLPPASHEGATTSTFATPEKHTLDYSVTPESVASTVAARPRESKPSLGDREPALLTLPTRGVHSEVIEAPLGADLGVVVPEDVSLTGWYDRSKRLDARKGATVIVGHRDARSQGPGALYGIEELQIGESIEVMGNDGLLRAFTVSRVEVINKSDLPARAPDIFSRNGPARLVLITCGGAFDEPARSYVSNIVVTATPATGS